MKELVYYVVDLQLKYQMVGYLHIVTIVIINILMTNNMKSLRIGMDGLLVKILQLINNNNIVKII